MSRRVRRSKAGAVATLLLFAGCALAGNAFARDAAEPARAEGPPRSVTPGRRALAAGAAMIPGALVHGAGNHVLGEGRTGDRLLLAEGAGIGMTLGGGVTIALTGASRYLVGPAAAVTVMGLGLFFTSFAADVYGTLNPDAGAAGRRVTPAPFLESEVGYRQVQDPQFSFRHFLVQSVAIRAERFRVTPSGWFATNGESARYRIEGGYRLLGALPRRAPGDGLSSLDVVVAGVHHRYDPDGFAFWSGEVAVHGRYDLRNVGPTLRGAFVEGSLGYLHQWIDYDVRGLDVPTDDEMMLLARFGFGAVLRGRSGPGSEVLAYYDHRRDGYHGGFLMPGLGSGVAGHFGVTGRWYFGRSFGVLADAHVGAAVVFGASLLFRQW